MISISQSDKQVLDQLETMAEKMGTVREAVGNIIFGQDEVINLTLTAILGGGHALLVGAPGLAKTKLAITLGKVLGLEEKTHPVHP